TTLFVPGNHENYARLMSDEFPLKEWNGGMVKAIRPSIYMLMRGEMYEIDGAKFFAFGGASSHDISDGILDGADPDWQTKAKQLNRQGKYMYRIKGISWWEEELPTEEEMRHGLDVLNQNDWKTDFVITHCAPSSTQALLGFHDNNVLTKYLEEIRQKLTYKRWFFGHYHDNRQVNAQDILLYEQLVRVW
ncbi:MAG: metallophosphatase, partial [Lachnospiraceae bacterium]|nr:metallophosphatase [Lachnospiraceae bacterium]